MILRMFCEDLGPTFIKFGQIVASSAGMFPDAYVKEFQKVLDRVKPFQRFQRCGTDAPVPAGARTARTRCPAAGCMCS